MGLISFIFEQFEQFSRKLQNFEISRDPCSYCFTKPFKFRNIIAFEKHVFLYIVIKFGKSNNTILV